jgi:hypothetical protein
MFKIRGRTESGDSMTGISATTAFADAAEEAEAAANKAGDPLVHLTIKPLDGGAGLKIAEPRKRETPAKKKK